MYLLGFAASYFLVRLQILENCQKRQKALSKEVMSQLDFLDSLMIVLVTGVIIGGRLGYVLFYNLTYFIHNPSEIFATWHGGMSFHGGLAGAVAAGLIYCQLRKEPFLMWADRFIVTAPIGLGLGRLGNFINGELFGRPTDVPWAMIFPHGGFVPRHPSQIYEAFLEGIVLFLILWPLRKKKWPHGKKLALFLICYGIFRIFVEFFREPDPQLGFILFGWITMGQILSFALSALGLVLWWILSLDSATKSVSK